MLGNYLDAFKYIICGKLTATHTHQDNSAIENFYAKPHMFKSMVKR